MASHAKLFNQLFSGPFVKNLACAYKEIIHPNKDENEVTIMAQAGVELRDHYHEDICIHDAAVSLFPFGGYEFSAAIEIKGRRYDLKKDQKMHKYLGATDTFYIAVSAHNLALAIAKINQDPSTKHLKGVINITKGEIVIRPKIQKVLDRGRLTTLWDDIIKGKYIPKAVDARLLEFDVVTMHQDDFNNANDWVMCDGLCINANYMNMYKKWKKKGKLQLSIVMYG